MDALGLNRYCCRRMIMVRRLVPNSVCIKGWQTVLAAPGLDAPRLLPSWVPPCRARRVPCPAMSTCAPPPAPQTHVDLIEKLLNYNTLERNPVQQREQREQPAQQQQQQQQDGQ